MRRHQKSLHQDRQSDSDAPDMMHRLLLFLGCRSLHQKRQFDSEAPDIIPKSGKGLNPCLKEDIPLKDDLRTH